MVGLAKGLFAVCFIWSTFAVSTARTFQEDLTLTSHEKRILDKFKELVVSRVPVEYMTKDVYLIRWLRARQFNIKDAEKMLMDHLQWWEENRMGTIHQEDWSDFDRDYPFWLEGRDNEGKPLLYINAGRWDLRKSSVTGASKRFQRYIDMGLDRACGLVRELGDKYQNVSQGILMINLDGFNIIQHGCIQCIPMILRIIVTYENHFPGCADKIILLNTPNIAEPIIAAARGVFHPDTNRILEVYGTNKRKWQQILANYFYWDQLPIEVGGTKLYKGMDDDADFY